MSKFKVGDEVECVADGRLGTVAIVTAGVVCVTIGGGQWFFEPDDIQLVSRREFGNTDSDPAPLTRRDRFAMAALTGLLMKREFGTYQSRVDDAFAIADLMEAARNKEGK